MFMSVRFMLKLNHVDCYFDCTNVANEDCEKFGVKKVFKGQEKRMI